MTQDDLNRYFEELNKRHLSATTAARKLSSLRQLYKHPLTDAGLAAFLADWEKTGQSILDS